MNSVFSQLFSTGSQSVFIDNFGENLPYSHGVFSNGLYEQEFIKKIGKFVTLKSKFETLSSIPCFESFSFSNEFIKIPIGVLYATIDFYRLVMKTYQNSEVMTMVVYDSILRDYKIIVPEQFVSGATVKYDHVTFSENEEYIVSMHSHNTMKAFFSVPDDNDEKRAMLYGVLGKLSGDSYETLESKFRAKKGSFQKELSIDDIFDLSENDKTKYIVNESELLKVKPLLLSNSLVPFNGYIHNNVYKSTNSYLWGDDDEFFYTNKSYYKKDSNTKPSFKNGLFSTLKTLSEYDPRLYLKFSNFLTTYNEFLSQYLVSGEIDTEISVKLSDLFYEIFESFDLDDIFYNSFFEKINNYEP